MPSRSFRPQLEELGGRRLPSANISIGDVTLAEGNAGQTAYVFTVNLSEASSRQVSVKYATATGTAKTGTGDFVGKSGTLTFAPGETTKTITVLVNGDAAIEQDERFFVNLSRVRNATIADAQGIGTIVNDDLPPPPPPEGGGGGGCNPSNPCDPLPPPPDNSYGGGGCSIYSPCTDPDSNPPGDGY